MGRRAGETLSPNPSKGNQLSEIGEPWLRENYWQYQFLGWLIADRGMPRSASSLASLT